MNTNKLPFPHSIFEFADQFATDEACWSYLKQSRWPEGFKCPRCGAKEKTFITTRRIWRCLNDHDVTVTDFTVMHKTHTRLKAWFWVAFLMATTTPGISATQLARKLNKRYETCYMMLQKLRAATVSPERSQIGGTVEVDETIVGGKSTGGKRGRGAPRKTLVLCMVEVVGSHAGRIRMRRIASAGESALIGAIRKYVRRGSTIVTDGWSGYQNLPGYGYKHVVRIAEPGDKHHLEHAHRAISNLKTWINGTHHGVSSKHFQAYLNEFTFRFNRRKTPMAAFQTLLGIGSKVRGPEYDQLYQVRWVHPNPKDV